MATNAAFPPYEMISDNGGFEGIDVEIATAIAQKLGLELVVDDMEFNSVIISVVACVLVSIVFGTVFAITLPSGFCTIEIPAWNFIMY
jgi:ABC-type amino acid transport substrate-binding protein